MTAELYIHIVGNAPGDVEVCVHALAAARSTFFRVVTSLNVQSFLKSIETAIPDCVLLDSRFPVDDGMAVLNAIRANYPMLPVIILAGQGNETAVANWMKAGANEQIPKDNLDTPVLEKLIADAVASNFIDSTRITAPLVLLVDDNPDDRDKYIRLLKKIRSLEYRYIEAEGYESMQRHMAVHRIDCILLDYSLPGRSGLDILYEVVRKHPHLPIIMMTGQGNEAVAVQAIKGGAQHYLVKSDITEESLHTHITTAIQHCDAERERKNLLQKLKETNLRYERTQGAIAQAMEGISFIDPLGRYVTLNEAYAEMTGYKLYELIGRNWMAVAHADEQPKLEEAYHGMLETGKVVTEVRGIKRDGSELHKRVTMISQYDEPGVFVGFHCFMQDITAFKTQEKDQQKLLEKLIESNTQLERFAYIASHDMQEPIRMVTSFGALLLQDYENILDETGRSYLRMLVDSGVRMKDMVEDLLSYSRLGNEHAPMLSCDGNKIYEGIRQNLQALIDESEAEVTADPLPNLYGNPVQLLRLLQNLVVNGIKYQSGGSKAKVHISAGEDARYWRISVADNGIGIKPEFQEAIFQPFRRLHTWDSIQGTGLGLSICRKIAENHLGALTVESTFGNGSIFSFTIKKPSQKTTEII